MPPALSSVPGELKDGAQRRYVGFNETWVKCENRIRVSFTSKLSLALLTHRWTCAASYNRGAYTANGRHRRFPARCISNVARYRTTSSGDPSGCRSWCAPPLIPNVSYLPDAYTLGDINLALHVFDAIQNRLALTAGSTEVFVSTLVSSKDFSSSITAMRAIINGLISRAPWVSKWPLAWHHYLSLKHRSTRKA